MQKKPGNESKRLKNKPTADDPESGNPTVFMKSEGVEDTKLMAGERYSEGAGVRTEEVSQDAGLGTDMATQSIDESFPLSGKEGGPTETEEVLVLLPEDGEKDAGGRPESIPFVETQEVEEAPFESTSRSAGIQGRAVARETENIESIGLKSVNPLSGEADSPTPGSGGLAVDTENIGVMDEIAELATSLDEDILNADSSAAPPSKGRGIRPAPPRPVTLPGDDLLIPPPRKSRSKAGILLVVSGLAASVGVGLYFFPEINQWYKTQFGGGTATAAVKPGANRQPLASSGQKPGGVEVAGTHTGGAASRTGAGGHEDEPEESGSNGSATPGSEAGSTGDLSQTRITVRKKILLALRLGLPRSGEKESE